MAKYQKYAEYKDSGVDWLGEIPQKWSVWKLNHFAPIVTCGVAATPEYQDEGIPFLSAQNVKKKKIDLSKGYKFISTEKHEELTRNRKPEKGDILLSRVGTIGEGCIVDVDFEFSIFVSLTHLRLIQKVCVNEFFIYLTESSYIKALHGAVTLVGGGVGNLNVNDLREYKLPIPSVSEQIQIANFLDHETAKIDSLIEKQQKLIELLKEKRQAVISHAVTKGLNPDVPMKDSGVEWLGQVPEHWEIPRLKQLVRYGSSISYGIVQPGDALEEGVPFIQTTNISKGSFKLEDFQKTSASIESNYPRSRLEGGEVILGIRASIGAAFVVPMSFKGVNLSRGIARILPIDFLSSDFLVWYFKSNAVDQYWGLSKQGSTFSEVSIETVKELNVVIPPIKEQEAISEFLLIQSDKFNNLIEAATSQKQLLLERRTALISAAVTGKIDVRNWQAPNATEREMEVST
ncbi:restriction endonuclease subunit S [Acinetobacter towneri]|uniref:restriction endonuclease subunit S n=1 Tax=Acinetobacter towneri TaxID=202956 RepID=UPI0002CE03F6|nr:restriction endonuclease subunit S [Acinetobacter towneri]ENV70700.1 hypothetical protein F947_00706 [Acinetobacter towneri DSM 14962 = CIP 107472]